MQLRLFFALCLIPAVVNAQYKAGKNYLCPSIGFAFLGSTPDFGASYEYGMDLQNFGLVGIGGLFRYWGVIAKTILMVNGNTQMS